MSTEPNQTESNPVDDFLGQKVSAVVGASREADKFGFKVYRTLKNGGYEVYPVNPAADSILGDKCYPSLSKLPKVPDVVSLIIPPHEGEKVVLEAAQLGIKRIWFQPGAESDHLLALCLAKDIAVLHSVCVMVETKKAKG